MHYYVYMDRATKQALKTAKNTNWYNCKRTGDKLKNSTKLGMLGRVEYGV